MIGSLQSAMSRLARSRELDEVLEIVRVSARQLLDAQGATFVLRDGDRCFYADEDSIAPLWKGQRFPLTECVSGWAMLHHASAVIPDISIDPRIPQEAYRPTYVKAMVMVPIRRDDPLGAIGAYWSYRYEATPTQILDLELLGEAAGAALDRIGLDDAPWAPTFTGLAGTPAIALQPLPSQRLGVR